MKKMGMGENAKPQATLDSPFVTWRFTPTSRADFLLKFAVWMIFWIAVCIGLLYVYAVTMKDWIGFESALLVGVGILILTVNGEQ